MFGEVWSDDLVSAIYSGSIPNNTPTDWPKGVSAAVYYNISDKRNKFIIKLIRRLMADGPIFTVCVISQVDSYPESSVEFTAEQFEQWFQDVKLIKSSVMSKLSTKVWTLANECCGILATVGEIDDKDFVLIMGKEHVEILLTAAPYFINWFGRPEESRSSTGYFAILLEEEGRHHNNLAIKVYVSEKERSMIKIKSTFKDSSVRGVKFNIAQFNDWIEDLRSKIEQGKDINKIIGDETYYTVFTPCEHTVTTKGKINGTLFTLCLSNDEAKLMIKAADEAINGLIKFYHI